MLLEHQASQAMVQRWVADLVRRRPVPGLNLN
jgi:hypothetical protein